MAAIQFRLMASHKDDLATICGLGGRKLVAIADRIESSKLTIRRTKIDKMLMDEIGEGPGTALSSVLFGIAGTFRRAAISAGDALERVGQSLGDAKETDTRFAKWDECRGPLKRILETRSVTLAAKALDVSYDFERVYLAGRILTSIRPIFDEPREEIVGSTIVQTLRLEYLAPNGDQSSISVAMDLDDVNRLKDECERAENKAAAAKVRIEKECDFEAIIPGEEVHE